MVEAIFNARWFGIFLGLLSSAAYGLIPFFALPLYANGVSVSTALVYRFGVATLVMFPLLVFMGEHLKVSWRDFFKLGLLSSFYLFAVIVFFHSFRYLPSSVAATIQFLYPLMVMLIMIFFFNEKFNWKIAMAVGLGIGGVAFLSFGADAPAAGNALLEENSYNIIIGICLSLLSGLGNSLYMVAIQVMPLPKINGIVMTFYVMLFGTIYSFIYSCFDVGFKFLTDPYDIFLGIMLALVTAVISNLALILAIKNIGSTLSAILGVMEPLTAVAVGILFFKEPFTIFLAGGVILIISSVFIAILAPTQK